MEKRPLNFFLSKFGISVEKLPLYLYLTSRDILRAFQKNKFNSDPEKVADVAPPYLSSVCRFGANYEMEFPKDAP